MKEKPYKILLVEDEALIGIAEKRQLEKIGYVVDHVRTGDAAVVTALDADTRPDLILMDIDLGEGIDGTEAAQRILNEIVIPIVFLSSHTDPEVVEKTEKISSYGYVVKNSGITVLDASIKMAFKLFDTRRDLIESERRYHQIFEHSIDAFALHDMIYDDNGDPVDYRFIAVNPAFEKITGLNAANVVNRRVLEVLPNTEQHWIETYGKVARTGEPVVFENYAQEIGKYFEVTAFQPAENQFACIFGDTTERRRMENALRERENEYRRLFETMSTGVVYQSAGGRIVSANPAAEKMLGLSRSQMNGMSSMDPRWKMVDEQGNDVPGNEHPVMVALRTGTTIGPVERAVFVPETNRYVWLSITATPLFYPGEDTPYQSYATFDDITERKEIERALVDQQQFLETILQTTVVGFWVFLVDGTISMVNEAYCRMSGYTRDELVGMVIDDVEVCEDIQEIFERIERIMKKGSEVIETQHRRKDGTVFDEEVSLSRLDRLEEICVVCFCRDITERKRAEEEIQRQLALKDTLLKEVHHRIKNNMAQIENLLLIQADSAGSADVKTALKQATSRVRSTRTLYEKLLIGKDYVEVSMKEYLEGLIDLLVEVYDDQSDVSIERSIVDFPLGPKKAIPIGIILNELLTNVFKYAFHGRSTGRISIVLERTTTGGTLIVQDDGVGWDEQGVANRTSGFGLTLTTMLAEQLEGTFTYEIDNGTRSVVTFDV